MGKFIALLFVAVVMFAIGSDLGYESGIRDTNSFNKEVCNVSR